MTLQLQPPTLEHAVTPGRKGTRAPLPKFIWALAALVLIIGFNLIFTPNFWRIWIVDGHLFGSLIDIPMRAAPVMLVTLGMTLVLATGGVDLSVGSVIAICGSVAAVLLEQYHLPLPLVLAVTLLAALAAGVWNGLLVAVVDLQPIVATLILMVAGRGVAQVLSDGQKVPIHSEAFHFIGGKFLLGIPFNIILAAIVIALIAILTRRTAAGLFVESVGNNSTASHYAGVSARLVKIAVYGLCGLCSGIAGVMLTSNYMESDPSNSGLYMELDAILAAVIGGTALNGGRFSLLGSVIGALVIQAVTTTIQTRGIPAGVTLVAKSLIVLGVCLLQSDALRRSLWRKFRRASA